MLCIVMLKTECLSCDNVSKTYESFTDLSLDFPQQYHATNDDMSSACTDSCKLTGLSAVVDYSVKCLFLYFV